MPIGDHALDYSHGTHLTLNEAALDEHVGVCGTGYPIDWNTSGTFESSVGVDLDNAPGFQTYSDYDDWSHLSLAGLGNADGARAGVAPSWVVEQPAGKR